MLLVEHKMLVRLVRKPCSGPKELHQRCPTKDANLEKEDPHGANRNDTPKYEATSKPRPTPWSSNLASQSPPNISQISLSLSLSALSAPSRGAAEEAQGDVKTIVRPGHCQDLGIHLRKRTQRGAAWRSVAQRGGSNLRHRRPCLSARAVSFCEI